MIPMLVAVAWAGLREDAELTQEAGDFSLALRLWTECAEAEGKHQRFCQQQSEFFQVQSLDQFAGWAVLASVRQNYLDLGPDRALDQIEAAYQKNPSGPAAPELLKWLANDYARRQDTEKLAWARQQLEGLGAPEQVFARHLEEKHLREQLRGKVLWGTGLGVGLWVGMGGLVRGPWPWRSALGAMGLVGAVPLGMAYLYEPSWASGFGMLLGWVGISVLVGARLPVVLAFPGILLGFAFIIVQNQWWW